MSSTTGQLCKLCSVLARKDIYYYYFHWFMSFPVLRKCSCLSFPLKVLVHFLFILFHSYILYVSWVSFIHDCAWSYPVSKTYLIKCPASIFISKLFYWLLSPILFIFPILWIKQFYCCCLVLCHGPLLKISATLTLV